jgi:outer membrane protein
MKILFKGLFLTIFLASASLLSAQKVGHIDYGSILSAMPETKKADSDIAALKTQLSKKAEGMQNKMQAKQKEAMTLAEQGKLTPEMEKTYTAQLEKMQKDLEKFAGDADETIQKKRDELLKPILDKVETAVKDVAKEKGIAYVLDTSTLLYFDPTNDITPDVKVKLALP